MKLHRHVGKSWRLALALALASILGDDFVKYRFTYPGPTQETATARIQAFMGSLSWPD